MQSPKRRTITKSGRSAGSQKTATSSRKGSSSQTAPASFVEIFGEAPQDDPERRRLTNLLGMANARLQLHLAKPEPTLALYKTQLKQKIARERKQIRDLEAALKALTA